MNQEEEWKIYENIREECYERGEEFPEHLEPPNFESKIEETEK